MLQILNVKGFRTPPDNTFIASCMTTLDDLVKTSAIEGKHIHCCFPLKDNLDLFMVERKLRKKKIVSITFSNHKVFLLDESYQYE